MMLRSLGVAAALIAAPAVAQAQTAAPAARSAPPAAAAPAASPAPTAKPKAKRSAVPTATADGAKRERSPAQLANDQKMRECGAEWRAAKAAGKTGSQKWNQFLSECRKRKA
ncbi:MAG: hypothetical protein RQ833_09630 [Sphingomonadaceae bacterium]|nr:hypothetical protein [Sphingomonadaceae bacterium]